jgi:hypothetical protein
MSHQRNIAVEVLKSLDQEADGFGGILVVEVFAAQVVAHHLLLFGRDFVNLTDSPWI